MLETDHCGLGHVCMGDTFAVPMRRSDCRLGFHSRKGHSFAPQYSFQFKLVSGGAKYFCVFNRAASYPSRWAAVSRTLSASRAWARCPVSTTSARSASGRLSAGHDAWHSTWRCNHHVSLLWPVAPSYLPAFFVYRICLVCACF